MSRLAALVLAVGLAGTSLHAQGAAELQPTAPCVRPDSIAVQGASRVPASRVLTDAGVVVGDTLNYRVVQRAIRNLYATGQFTDVVVSCAVDTTVVSAPRAMLVIAVHERPVLARLTVAGTRIVSRSTIEGKLGLAAGRPLDPAKLGAGIARIDSIYAAKGYFLAQVRPETTTVAPGRVAITLRVHEGRRVAISGIQVTGDRRVKASAVAGAMNTRPEGFWWFHRGRFDPDEFAQDVRDRIPKFYADRGFLDARVARDTVVVDRQTGKAVVRVTVHEGPEYRLGHFEIIGNRHFSTEQLDRFYPFGPHAASFTDRVKGLLGHGSSTPADAFDLAAWNDATDKVRTAYADQGYIYAQVRPVVDRGWAPAAGRQVVARDSSAADSVPVVNLRWEIAEGTPATVNRIEIVGNDYTTDACIREQLVLIPGELFNQQALIRSYQSIQNLGFFESPLPAPDTKPADSAGDVDVIFHVKEKHTGSVNFGASVGQGTGLGGFIGLDQPNLFGKCKRASLQWQFGGYQNDFEVSYTDPAIRESMISGTVTAYDSRSRYIIADLGQSQNTGGSLQFGFPFFGSRFTRVFLSYGAEAVRFSGGLASRDSTINTGTNFRSTVGVTLTNDTRIDLPFASAGSERSITAQFNGGPLGGSSAFQRYTADARNYTTLAQFGGKNPGSQPIKLVLGLTAKAGALFGNVGPFFYSQSFALGGVQYGEMLRGYPEFSVTPTGYVPNAQNANVTRSSFGNAFFTGTAELGVRFNQTIYTDFFFDAGNIWATPSEFDPTRLFRGAGLGLEVVTPLGPLGLDWGYGFDRVNQFGQKDPKWQLHFRLGNLY